MKENKNTRIFHADFPKTFYVGYKTKVVNIDNCAALTIMIAAIAIFLIRTGSSIEYGPLKMRGGSQENDVGDDSCIRLNWIKLEVQEHLSFCKIKLNYRYLLELKNEKKL